MMTQLRHARILDRAKVILGGQFTDCAPKDPSKASLSIDDIFREIGSAIPTPFLARLPFGHEARKITIPIGIRGRVHVGAHTLEYLEGAVR